MKLDSWSIHYAIREKRNLEKDLFPFLGARHIGEIEAIELLATVRRVEERGALDVAHRVLTTAGQVWRYAVATGRAVRDVSAAAIGCNPSKPRPPSHVPRTVWVGSTRLAMDVQVRSGRQHASVHAEAALEQPLDEWGNKRPTVAREESGYDNEPMLLEWESRGKIRRRRLQGRRSNQERAARSSGGYTGAARAACHGHPHGRRLDVHDLGSARMVIPP